ncbi:uncharacterized protein YALI1_F16459g [Yarrowia lipolytica]|uniref:Uncharacterized protein n=1 Tax=Yarrowia lipolytica TaxID=4952 RepID=A0A1D8NN33_YARLL|nr:hypothetical protein YALI1_F16459g [Yarrowia lipolytica]
MHQRLQKSQAVLSHDAVAVGLGVGVGVGAPPVVPSTKRQHSATAYDLQSTNERTPFTADLALRLILTGKPTLPLAQTHSTSRSNPLSVSLRLRL